MRDYYGNKVSVTYSQSGQREGCGGSPTPHPAGVHRIYFHLDDANRAGNDAAPGDALRLPNGDQLGDLRRVVDEVVVAGRGRHRGDLRLPVRDRHHQPLAAP